MNDKDSRQMDALMGGGQPANETDWKQKYEEAERALNSARVEEGRVKKLNGELEAARREIEELRSAKGRDDLMSSLSEDERNSIPEEVLAATSKLVTTGMSRIQAQNEERWNREEQERTAIAKGDFVSRINSRYPGFMDSVSAGGDKAQKWSEYVRYNKASIADAYANYDFSAISYHIEQFYSSFLGIRVPSGVQDGSAAPDPRTSGGGTVGSGLQIPGQTYTQQEYLELYDKVEAARAKGDYAEMKRLSSEIEKAPRENRVK